MKTFLAGFILLTSISSFAEVAEDFAGGIIKNRRSNEYLAAKCTNVIEANKCGGYTFVVLTKIDKITFEVLGDIGVEKTFAQIKTALKPALDADLNMLTDYKFDRLPIYMASKKKIGKVMILKHKHYSKLTDALNQ